MNLINQVYDSLKWKRTDEYAATKLGITIEQYKTYKSQISSVKNKVQDDLDGVFKSIIQKHLDGETSVTFSKEQLQASLDAVVSKVVEFKENMEEGTAEVKALSSVEPRSPEEVEELVKIAGSPKWKLSNYWNKQQPNGMWLVSASICQINKNDPGLNIKAVLDSIDLSYQPVSTVHINSNFTDPTLAVLSLQDIHVAKQTIDTQDIAEDVKRCVTSLIQRSYHSHFVDKIIFVLGGDLVNMDTYNGTTTAGTVVENAIPAYDAYQLAFEIMFWSVNYLKQFCNELEVVYIPGNHSRLTEAHIAYSLSRVFNDPAIKWNIEYAERKVIVYGENMICLEHGDFDTRKSPLVFATEYPKEWGTTKFRTLYTGHYHKSKKIEYITEDENNGFTFKILPSLSKTDRYHHSNKWTGSKRGGVIYLHSRSKGEVAAFSWYE